MRELKIENTDKIAIVDDEDYFRLSLFKWRYNGISNIQREIPKTRTSKRKRLMVSLASEVMHRPGIMFDHADRNHFNNQKSNLRECTQSQNNHNRTKRKGTYSKFFGVCFYRPNGLWQAQIKLNGKCIYLGRYTTEVLAAKAYNNAATRFFKEFANLNKDENGVIL